jgi:hypothetical protein
MYKLICRTCGTTVWCSREERKTKRMTVNNIEIHFICSGRRNNYVSVENC